jgi:hypothetical protein
LIQDKGHFIMINGLSQSYKYFLETLQIIDTLSTATFDLRNELLTQHSKSFGKQKQPREDRLFNKAKSSKGRGKQNFGKFQN